MKKVQAPVVFSVRPVRDEAVEDDSGRAAGDGSGQASAEWVGQLAIAASLVVILVSLLAIPVQTATDRGLSPAQTSSWIVALFGLPGALSIVLVWRYRQPLLMFGNVFVWFYFARLGPDIAWSELVGASMVAGAIVIALGPLGLTRQLARWLPPSIVSALLAGAVLGFFIDMFSSLDREFVLVGSSLAAFLLARATGRVWLPPMLPTLAVGLAAAALSGKLGSVPSGSMLPTLTLTWPTFSLTAIATVAPVMVLLMTLPSNVPAVVLLKGQGYDPPEGVIGAASGLITAVGSLLGPTAISLSLPGIALCSSPEAGHPSRRHRVIWLASLGGMVIAVFAGIAAHAATIVPRELLVAFVGLAVVGIVANALKSATSGSLLLGPIFTFAIAMSEMSLLGLGSFFWAIIGGFLVSLLLEHDEFIELTRAQGP